MQLDIQSRGFYLTKGLSAHIKRRVAFALSARHEQIQRVQVRLADINGPRGGKDKQCQVHVVLAGMPDVVTENVESNQYAAIDLAVGRAGHTVARRLLRLRAKARATSISPTAGL